ncbi:MAG TPA: glycosyltransferase family 2 protein [Ignavibacteriaceae bacterium]|nr:glycosyltransferase family 2 protein [Ignavibacteriaceae bacterium]
MSNSKDINKITKPVCAVIPFFNEKETLNLVLDETLKYVSYIFAVNDGSNDDTYQIEREKSELEIIDINKNYGKGKALRVGFEAAISSGYEIVVTLDADLQHEPKYIPRLIEGLQSFDIVIGNRLKNLKDMPIQRRLSNKLTSFFLTLKTGQNILDSQCGYRAFRTEVLKEVKTNYLGFEAESEILVKAAKKGFKIGFVDIPTIYGNEKSKMRPVQAIVGFLRVLFSKTIS